MGMSDCIGSPFTLPRKSKRSVLQRQVLCRGESRAGEGAQTGAGGMSATALETAASALPHHDQHVDQCDDRQSDVADRGIQRERSLFGLLRAAGDEVSDGGEQQHGRIDPRGAMNSTINVLCGKTVIRITSVKT